jgi:hypothetical protein
MADVIRIGDMVMDLGKQAMELTGLRKGGIREPGRRFELLTEPLHPLFKAAIESTTGTSLFSGKPLYAYSGEEREALGVKIPAWTASLLTAVGIVNTIKRFTDEDKVLGARLLNTFTGIYQSVVDVGRQRRTHNAQVQDDIARLYRGIKQMEKSGDVAGRLEALQEVERLRRTRVPSAE